ncbi:MAG: DUF411 domain-containing protein [Salinarimonas sp.]
MREAGFAMETRASAQINRIKARLGVPAALASFHPAEMAGYVIEGHVPAKAGRRLLRERPDAMGIGIGIFRILVLLLLGLGIAALSGICATERNRSIKRLNKRPRD